MYDKNCFIISFCIPDAALSCVRDLNENWFTAMNFKIIAFVVCLFLSANTKADSNLSNFINVKCTTDTITQAVIDVEYKPVDQSGLNWKDELELARVIPTLNGKGVRISLPNADTAKVIILDRTAKRKLKSILYVAPAVIDISDLKNGDYKMIIHSHNVSVVKSFTKSKNKRKK